MLGTQAPKVGTSPKIGSFITHPCPGSAPAAIVYMYPFIISSHPNTRHCPSLLDTYHRSVGWWRQTHPGRLSTQATIREDRSPRRERRKPAPHVCYPWCRAACTLWLVPP